MLCNFSGLSFHGRLWVWSDPVKDEEIEWVKGKISDVIGSSAIPLATSSYLGDGCVIWVDEAGRFYAVDSEGVIYLSSDMITLLEVLLASVVFSGFLCDLRNKSRDIPRESVNDGY